MFDRVGVVEFDAKAADRRRDAGGRDRGRRRGRRRRARTATRSTAHRAALREVAKALEAKFGEPRKAALVWKPQNTVPVDDEAGEKVLKLIDALNDQDDVQNVYCNFEMSDAVMAKLGA